jgi:hypothetical protein
MAENAPGKVLFSETLRMRSLPLSVYAGLSLLLALVLIITTLPSEPETFKILLMFVVALVFFWIPTTKYVLGSVISEIRSDGLYVRTNFPLRRHIKLFGWEQLTECNFKYYPKFGDLGHSLDGFSSPWHYGYYAAYNLRYNSDLCFKPLFGEKEVHFVLGNKSPNGLIVMDTNSPPELAEALREAMGYFPNQQFGIIFEEEPSLRNRFTGVILIALAIIVITILLLKLVSLL